MSNLHIVVKNDTLTKISKLHGVSIKELQTINHLPNPNKLDIGQSIILKKEQVLGFQALLLGADRNPINGQKSTNSPVHVNPYDKREKIGKADSNA